STDMLPPWLDRERHCLPAADGGQEKMGFLNRWCRDCSQRRYLPGFPHVRGARAAIFVNECSILSAVRAVRCKNVISCVREGASTMSPRFFAGVVALVVGTVIPAGAQQPSAAGRIKVASGAAFIVRDGQPMPAQVGQDVFATDGLRTGDDGRIGVTLT